MQVSLIEQQAQKLDEKYRKQGFKGWRARVFKAQPRWEYLAFVQTFGRLPPAAIRWPRYSWVDDHRGVGKKMVENCLRPFSGNVGFDDLLKVILYKLGHPEYDTLPTHLEAPHMTHIEKVFDMEGAIQLRADFLGDSYGEFQGKYTRQRNGYYPTPMSVAVMKADLLFGDRKPNLDETVLDCCGGSGRLLFPASNHSLRLYYQDVEPICYRIGLINGFLFMPQLIWSPPKEVFKSGEVIRLQRSIENNLPKLRRKNEFKRRALPESRPKKKRNGRKIPPPALPGACS